VLRWADNPIHFMMYDNQKKNIISLATPLVGWCQLLCTSSSLMPYQQHRPTNGVIFLKL